MKEYKSPLIVIDTEPIIDVLKISESDAIVGDNIFDDSELDW